MMMTATFLLLAFASLASAANPLETKFNTWTLEHTKSYDTVAQRMKAMGAFIANEFKIQELNSNEDDSAVYGHTRFSDMTPEEFKGQFLGVQAGAIDEHASSVGVTSASAEEQAVTPAAWDWRDQNAVTAVRTFTWELAAKTKWVWSRFERTSERTNERTERTQPPPCDIGSNILSSRQMTLIAMHDRKGCGRATSTFCPPAGLPGLPDQPTISPFQNHNLMHLFVTLCVPLPPPFLPRRDNQVKDQSSCGSCWAESAVQNIESVHFLATTAANSSSRSSSSAGPVPLSTEQVIECDPFDYACYGGFPSGAFKYVLKQGGLATQDSYPYDMNGKTICLANQTFNATCGDGICDDPPLTSWCDLTCSASKHDLVAKIDSWTRLDQNETMLAAYLAAHNPISVALDAGGPLGALLPWLQFYKHGVANPKHCATNSPDHAVLLVGFGTDNGQDYWTVKNSWGQKWGEEGYFRIARGTSKCGINTLASTSVVSK